MSHTKEPWLFNDREDIRGNGDTLPLLGISIPMTAGARQTEAKANARRIVACVNACEGMSTEFLENTTPHQVKTLVGFAGELERSNAKQDKLRELCASIYQFAGAMDAPVDVLDALSNAASGDDFTMPEMPYDVHPCEKERDTYRQLCEELIRSARAKMESSNLNEHVKAKFELEVVIIKAETILGEKNGNAN